MFDKAIIDTDRFMDLSMSSKALYFLLGMEADDEGFVSYKKVMRVHGGNADDMGILVAKRFLISFESGVVVITDWNKNNYLDKNRTRATEYQKEKKMLVLTGKGEYVLNTGSTSIEEYRVEEKEKTVTETAIAVSSFSEPEESRSEDVTIVYTDEDFNPLRTKKTKPPKKMATPISTADTVPTPVIKKPYSFEGEMRKLWDSERKQHKIIALYWTRKKYYFENREQFSSNISRDNKMATPLVGYTSQQIKAAMEICEHESIKLGYEWNLATVFKKITNVTRQ